MQDPKKKKLPSLEELGIDLSFFEEVPAEEQYEEDEMNDQGQEEDEDFLLGSKSKPSSKTRKEHLD